MSVDVFKPIPCLDEARQIKARYADYSIDATNPAFSEPLVALADYGVEGISYYSQPNSVTTDPVEGVSPHIYVRKTVAEKLAASNEFIQTHEGITKLYDDRIKLYIRDGFRSPQLQGFLYNSYIPRLLSDQNPNWTKAQVLARRDEVIALPKPDAPHAGGGAVDAILVSATDGSILNTGFNHASLGESAINTDYLEGIDVATQGLSLALQTRRVLHNVLTSEEVGGIAMVNNPSETWHYSYGDQMWALLSGQPAALYGQPPELPEELQMG